MKDKNTTSEPAVALDKAQKITATLLGLLPPLHKLPVKLFRLAFLVMDRLLGLPRIPLAQVEDHAIPLTAEHQGKVRAYYPTNKPLENHTMVYFHGGGCVIGSIETHDRFCRYLAKHANINILSVAYRLAPEFTFPTPIIDAITTWNWVHQHHTQLSINPSTLGVGGDSAGGYLACLMSLSAEQTELPVQARIKPRFQFLLYPMVDLQGKTESYLNSTHNLLLTKEIMDHFRHQYLTADSDLSLPLISPLQSRHLEQCPNTYLLTVAFDPLRDDGLAFAKRLTQAGCQVQHDHLPDCMHAFISVARISQRARQATHQVAQALAQLNKSSIAERKCK